MPRPLITPANVSAYLRGPQGLPGVGSAAFQPTHAYTVGSIVQHTDGTWLTCTTAHTSGSSIDLTKFAPLFVSMPGTGVADYAVASRLTSGANGFTWVTKEEHVARALGWTIVTDARYGAKGDGTTNDTAAWAAAIAATTVNGTVWAPDGTYLVTASTTSILTGANGITIRGAGATRSVLKVDAGATAGRLLDLSGKTNVLVTDLGFDGQSNASVRCAVYASTSGTQKNITVTRSKFTNWMPSDNTATAGAVYVWTADGVHVTDNEFVGCGRGVTVDQPDGHVNILRNRITAPVDNVMCTGISIRRSSSSSESKVLVEGNYIQGANRDTAGTGAEGHGIAVYRVRDVQIKGNHCVGNGRGVLVSYQSFGASVIGNHCVGNTDAGIRCEPEIATTSTTIGTDAVRGVTVIGNVCRDNVNPTPTAGYYGQGITISYAAGSVVANNIVHGNGSNGIHTDCDRVSIIGNTVYNNNKNYTPAINPAVRAGIRMYANSGCVVIGNQCFDNQTTKTQDYGLAMGSAGQVVFGNNFAGNAIADIYNPQHIVQSMDGAYNGTHLILGSNHLWFDGSGNPRVKASAPSSDADGTSLMPSASAIGAQVFTANGTWTKPAGATSVQVIAVGPGGGGGSGRRGAAGTVRCGGGGGGAGGIVTRTFRAADLGSTEAVQVGTGGAGGAAVTTDDTNGTNGSAGSVSTIFGTNKVRALAGAGGSGGTNSTGTGGNGGTGTASGSAGAAANVSGNVGNASATGGGAIGGGSGGGINTGNTASNGGASGALATVDGSTSAAGVVDTTGPGSATDATIAGEPGGGGGGGASSVTTAAQAGGNGAKYGGGGGGGGASVNGNNSGAGGNGADGVLIVFTW